MSNKRKLFILLGIFVIALIASIVEMIVLGFLGNFIVDIFRAQSAYTFYLIVVMPILTASVVTTIILKKKVTQGTFSEKRLPLLIILVLAPIFLIWLTLGLSMYTSKSTSYIGRMCPEIRDRLSDSTRELVTNNYDKHYLFRMDPPYEVFSYTDNSTFELVTVDYKDRCESAKVRFSNKFVHYFPSGPEYTVQLSWREKDREYLFGIVDSNGSPKVYKMPLTGNTDSIDYEGIVLPQKLDKDPNKNVFAIVFSEDKRQAIMWINGKAYYVNSGRIKQYTSDKKNYGDTFQDVVEIPEIPELSVEKPQDLTNEKKDALGQIFPVRFPKIVGKFSSDGNFAIITFLDEGEKKFLLDLRNTDNATSNKIYVSKLQSQDSVDNLTKAEGYNDRILLTPGFTYDEKESFGYYLTTTATQSGVLRPFNLVAMLQDGTTKKVAQGNYVAPKLIELTRGVVAVAESQYNKLYDNNEKRKIITLTTEFINRDPIIKSFDTNYFQPPFIASDERINYSDFPLPSIGYYTLVAMTKNNDQVYGKYLNIWSPRSNAQTSTLVDYLSLTNGSYVGDLPMPELGHD